LPGPGRTRASDGQPARWTRPRSSDGPIPHRDEECVFAFEKELHRALSLPWTRFPEEHRRSKGPVTATGDSSPFTPAARQDRAPGGQRQGPRGPSSGRAREGERGPGMRSTPVINVPSPVREARIVVAPASAASKDMTFLGLLARATHLQQQMLDFLKLGFIGRSWLDSTCRHSSAPRIRRSTWSESRSALPGLRRRYRRRGESASNSGGPRGRGAIRESLGRREAWGLR
jgi:hypothetical protein